MDLKKIFPKFIHTFYMLHQTYKYDCRRTLKYGFAYRHEIDNLKANLLMVIHTIEKGLTMPNAHANFGHDRIQTLIQLTEQIINSPKEKDSFEIKYALETLNDYILFHQTKKIEIEMETLNHIKKLGNKLCYYFNDPIFKQYQFTKNDFSKYSKASFEQFSQSRHTVRDYSNIEIPDDIFFKINNIANNSPSSCNRQTCKFYLIKNKEKMTQILNLQGGNRGFGNTATAVMIVTSNLASYYDLQERSQASINAGFYGMNLLYALHFYQIGACVLNWSYTKKKDIALRQMVPQIKDEELISFLICCGYPSDNFKVALSKRRNIDNHIQIIK